MSDLKRLFEPIRVGELDLPNRIVMAEREGRCVLQLWHTGRISHPNLHGGELPGAPSAVKPEGKAFTAKGARP